MGLHKQTSVVVNTNKGTAKKVIEVDGNIKNIIVTLNKFDGLETIECCQGDENNAARVWFKYKHWEHPYQGLVDFVFGFFAPYLLERVCSSVAISIHATSTGCFLAELQIRTGTIKMVEAAIDGAFLLFKESNNIKGEREIQEVSMVDAPAWYNSIEASAWAHGYAHALDKIKIQRKWMREEIEANNAWLPTVLEAFKILHDGTESEQKAALTSVLMDWKELTRTK